MKAVWYMTRKEAREQAFVLIFEKQFREDTPDEILEYAKEIRGLEVDEYTALVFRGVSDNCNALDEIITANLKNWRIERVSKVALAVLRLAIYEMKFVDEVPVSVSINEAVELCKKFAVKEDASFVNGILGSIAKAE